MEKLPFNKLLTVFVLLKLFFIKICVEYIYIGTLFTYCVKIKLFFSSIIDILLIDAK